MMGLDLKLIKKRRIELRLTQQDMVDRLSLRTRANYSRYESGKYTFGADSVPVLHPVLKMPTTKLFTQRLLK